MDVPPLACQRYLQSDSLLEETQIEQTLPRGLQVLERTCKGGSAVERGESGPLPSRAGRACPLGPRPTAPSWALVTARWPPRKDSPTAQQADPLPLLDPAHHSSFNTCGTLRRLHLPSHEIHSSPSLDHLPFYFKKHEHGVYQVSATPNGTVIPGRLLWSFCRAGDRGTRPRPQGAWLQSSRSPLLLQSVLRVGA